jgi:Cu(I)-responsive transcriptional regulator
MNIGEASKQSGVNAKMIRYYEDIGLIVPARRTAANYRIYSENDVHRLRFIRRARDLGFPIAKITELLDLWDDQRRSSHQVKALALQHIDGLRAQIRAMQEVVATLESLSQSCHGDSRAECPIIEELAGERPPCAAGHTSKSSAKNAKKKPVA